jgi:hypothetical protein
MKRTRLWQYAVPFLFLVTLMTSCGAQTSDGPATALATLRPNSSTPPQESCAAFLPSAPCATYASVSGTDSSKELPWVAAGAVKVQLASVNGGLEFRSQ